jgi:phytoene synthase
MTAADRAEAEEIFASGSRTYSTASRFFPSELRERVTVLYAFVRRADDYVDRVPQDCEGFRAFRSRWDLAKAGEKSGDAIVDNFAELGRASGFEAAWTEAFLDAMEADLSVANYDHIEDTLRYVYGSAEVIGLFMTRLLRLPREAEAAAMMLGRSMQFINFIRDFAEDRRLGRRYLPLDGGDPRLGDEAWAKAHRREFEGWLRGQVERYRGWGQAGRQGFRHIPRRMRIAVATAQDMYDWTAAQIHREPLRVFGASLKPGKPRIILCAIGNVVGGGLPK